MRFIRTRQGTGFDPPSQGLLRFAAPDTANPGYRGKYHRVHAWWIELDDAGHPAREIGLDEHGAVVMAGPSATDYGFWLDTDMRAGDFIGEPVAEADFERLWAASGVVAP